MPYLVRLALKCTFLFFSSLIQDEKYVHIEAEEMKKVKNRVEEKFNWFNEKLNEMGKCPPTKNPPVYPSQIETEKKVPYYVFAKM